jgi:hypothetical protein
MRIEDEIDAWAADNPDPLMLPPPEPIKVRTRCMSSIEPVPVRWLWQNRLPLGRMSLLIGAPGEGKSFATLDAAARVSTGTPWPDGAECVRGSVLLACAEDDPADTIAPRLLACGADMSRIHVVDGIDVRAGDEVHDRPWTLGETRALLATLDALEDVRLLVIDPVGSFLGGGTDSHRDTEVRSALMPLVHAVRERDIALLIVAHTRKGGGGGADERAMGSRAFVGLARAVHHVIRDKPDDEGKRSPRRLLLPGKSNLGPEGDGLAFIIGGDPPAICWERDPVSISADEAYGQLDEARSASRRGPEPEAQTAAAKWLSDILARGPVATKGIETEAREAGHSWATIRRAKDELGVIAERETYTGKYHWRLKRGPNNRPT